MNKNQKRIKREIYKAAVASTGHPPQYAERKSKQAKVARKKPTHERRPANENEDLTNIVLTKKDAAAIDKAIGAATDKARAAK